MNGKQEIQKFFFKTLSSIQDNAVYQALAEYKKSDSLEDLLYNATYEAIVSICELLDGYTSDKLQLDLIDTNSNEFKCMMYVQIIWSGKNRIKSNLKFDERL